jgi:hypothetical protein
MTYEGIQFKGIHFEANGEYDVQFELDPGERLPRWLVNALMDGELYAVPDSTCLLLGEDDDVMNIYPEDWVMYKEDVGIFMVSNNELLEDFDIAQEDQEPGPQVIRQDATVAVTGVSASGGTMPNIEGVPV